MLSPSRVGIKQRGFLYFIVESSASAIRQGNETNNTQFEKEEVKLSLSADNVVIC